MPVELKNFKRWDAITGPAIYPPMGGGAWFVNPTAPPNDQGINELLLFQVFYYDPDNISSDEFPPGFLYDNFDNFLAKGFISNVDINYPIPNFYINYPLGYGSLSDEIDWGYDSGNIDIFYNQNYIPWYNLENILVNPGLPAVEGKVLMILLIVDNWSTGNKTVTFGANTDSEGYTLNAMGYTEYSIQLTSVNNGSGIIWSLTNVSIEGSNL